MTKGKEQVDIPCFMPLVVWVPPTWVPTAYFIHGMEMQLLNGIDHLRRHPMLCKSVIDHGTADPIKGLA